MVKVLESFSKAVKWSASKKSFIARRLLIYFIIMVMIAPFVFVFRTEIYSKFLSRHDDYIESFDTNGLPVTDYGYQANIYIGPKTTPRAVANTAIEYYKERQAGNTSAEIYFNNTIDWLLEHRTHIFVPTENGTQEIVHWYFDFSIWNLPKGWYQAMTDAKALHALALAYDLFGDESLFEIIELTAKSFYIPISLGGNLYILNDGTHWYPEYIIPNELEADYIPDLILNGFLICLFHLYTANLRMNMTLIDKIFNLGVISAAANLYKYDMDVNWTTYHLAYPVKPAPLKYHKIHINLAGDLYEFTNITIFQHYHEKWESYTTKPSFLWDEITSPEFIYYGLVVAGLVLGPLIIIDGLQLAIRTKLGRK